MSRLLLIVFSLCLSASVFGQQVRSREAGFDDYRLLLEAAGYEAFGFDLSEFSGATCDMSVIVWEYAGGEPVDDIYYNIGASRIMSDEFSQRDHERIRPEDMADPEAGIFRRAERLTVGFFPSQADSVVRMVISVPGMMTSRSVLKLRAVRVPDMDRGVLYDYRTRPFEIAGAESGEFVPLVLFGSAWYDERAGLVRFCGESSIAPDMSSESEIVGNFLIST